MGSADKWREFITGMQNAGEFSADVIYDGTTNVNLLAVEFTNPTAYWKITVNDHTTAASCSKIVCAGFVTALGHSIPYDDKVAQNVTVKLTGVPVFTGHA
jgi:predicted secreted protein